MSSEWGPVEEVVVRIAGLRKTYRVFSRPYHRLLQQRADRKGTGKTYCFEVPAVDNVSFDLRRGEAIAIIGRNGSGKSTLLEMIAGTLEPSGGTVETRGRVSALLELGTGFNPDYSGRQNFRLNAAILGLTEREIAEIEPRVEAFAEIGAFLDEPVRTYSSGMYVRLAFATAVHVVPDVIIIDEALTVGDIFFQQKCNEYLLTELADATKIIVTHDLASAVRLADRCIVLDTGKVVFDGPPLEAVEAYTSLHLSARSITGERRPSTAIGSSASGLHEPETSTDDSAAELLEIDVSRSTNPDAMQVLRFGAFRRIDSELVGLPRGALFAGPGDELVLRFDIELGIAVHEAVFGYLIRDRVGNALFGQNSAGSGFEPKAMEPGRYTVDLELRWPEVEPGDYVLTFGLGDGRHPHHHSIVSWAQSVAKITAVPDRPVHGAFNNDLTAVRITATGVDAATRRSAAVS